MDLRYCYVIIMQTDYLGNLQKLLNKILLPLLFKWSPLWFKSFIVIFWCWTSFQLFWLQSFQLFWLQSFQLFWLQNFFSFLFTVFTESLETLSDLVTSSDNIIRALVSLSIFLASSTTLSTTTFGFWSRRSFVPTWRRICWGFFSRVGFK